MDTSSNAINTGIRPANPESLEDFTEPLKEGTTHIALRALQTRQSDEKESNLPDEKESNLPSKRNIKKLSSKLQQVEEELKASGGVLKTIAAVALRVANIALRFFRLLLGGIAFVQTAGLSRYVYERLGKPAEYINSAALALRDEAIVLSALNKAQIGAKKQAEKLGNGVDPKKDSPETLAKVTVFEHEKTFGQNIEALENFFNNKGLNSFQAADESDSYLVIVPNEITELETLSSLKKIAKELKEGIPVCNNKNTDENGVMRNFSSPTKETDEKVKLHSLKDSSDSEWVAYAKAPSYSNTDVELNAVCPTSRRSSYEVSGLHNAYVNVITLPNGEKRLNISTGVIDTKEKADAFVAIVRRAMEENKIQQASISMHQLNSFLLERSMIETEHALSQYIQAQFGDGSVKVTHDNTSFNSAVGIPGEKTHSNRMNAEAVASDLIDMISIFNIEDIQETPESDIEGIQKTPESNIEGIQKTPESDIEGIQKTLEKIQQTYRKIYETDDSPSLKNLNKEIEKLQQQVNLDSRNGSLKQQLRILTQAKSLAEEKIIQKKASALSSVRVERDTLIAQLPNIKTKLEKGLNSLEFVKLEIGNTALSRLFKKKEELLKKAKPGLDLKISTQKNQKELEREINEFLKGVEIPSEEYTSLMTYAEHILGSKNQGEDDTSAIPKVLMDMTMPIMCNTPLKEVVFLILKNYKQENEAKINAKLKEMDALSKKYTAHVALMARIDVVTGKSTASQPQRLAMQFLSDIALGKVTQFNCKSGLDRTGAARGLLSTLNAMIKEVGLKKTTDFVQNLDANLARVNAKLNQIYPNVKKEAFKKAIEDLQNDQDHGENNRWAIQFQNIFLKDLMRVGLPITARSTGVAGFKWHHVTNLSGRLPGIGRPLPYVQDQSNPNVSDLLPRYVQEEGKEEITRLIDPATNRLTQRGVELLEGLSPLRGG